ncbi:MAG: peptide ABC transporter substrate-binding protein [Puniceicoccales bacterium]|nr:peptide ABC transporter substrate-binding protein [Puniceicoccales bacterium]
MDFRRVIFFVCIVLFSGCFQREGQILRIGNAIEPATFDPQLAPGLAESKIVTALFEGLFVPDARTLRPVPGMAQSYICSPDGLEYTFFLRDNIFWSNGDPVVAKDFADAIERGLAKSIASPWVDFYFMLKNAQSYYNGEFSSFDYVGAKALSSKVLRLTLDRPLDFFPSLLTHWAWLPINRKAIERSGDFFDRSNRWTQVKNIVTNGPYLLKSFKVGDKVVVEKNKRYWDASNITIDYVHFISDISPATEENMFLTDRLDITENVPADKIQFYRTQGILPTAVSLGTSFYWFNCKQKPFDDVKIRKALSLAVDRDAIGKLRNRGQGFEAYALVPPGTMNYSSSKFFDNDVKQAQQLLAEAGYPNGEGFPPITILYNTSDNWKIISEAVQEMWRKNLKIYVQLQSIEWGTFLVERRQHKFSICRGGWVGDYNDASTFLNLLLSNNNNNHAQWHSKTYDQMLAQASQEKDSLKRSQILLDAETFMISEMPVIPIYFESMCHLVSSRIEGWYPNILDWHPIKFIRFQK